MWRKVLASILTLLAGFGFVLTSIMAELLADEDRPEEVAAGVVALIIVGVVTLAFVVASYLLFQRSKRRPQARLSWTPQSDQWLDRQAWLDLPDPLPKLPRSRKRRFPAVGVPPDELLRKLWAVRAEVAFDRAHPLSMIPAYAWLGTVVFFPALIFFIASVVVTLDNIAANEIIGVEWLFLEVLACVLIGCVAAFVRPIRRHRALLRMERELSGYEQRRATTS